MFPVPSRRALRRPLSAAAVLAAAAAVPAVAQDPQTRVVSQERGVTECADVSGLSASRSAKATPPFRGDLSFSDKRLSGDIEVSGRRFSFRTNIGVDAVIVKGGPESRVYLYEDEVRRDSGLRAPMNPNSGKPYGISHVIFCYDLGGDRQAEGGETAPEQEEDATLTRPSGRVSGTVPVGVGGRGIEEVRFSVNGRTVRTLRATRGRNVFRLNADMRRSARGVLRVRAAVRLASGRRTTLATTLRAARRGAVSPGFTG